MQASGLRSAWRLYRRHWTVFVGASAVLFLSWVMLEVAVIATQRLGFIAWAVLHAAFLIAFAGLVAGFHRLALDAVDGRELRFIDLFAAMDRGPALLLALIVYVALVAVGFVAFLAPGVYAAVRLSLIGQAAAAASRSPVGILKESASVTRGRWWGAAGTLGTVILLNALGAAVLGVGLLITWPLSVLLATALYRSLRPTR